MLRETAGNSDTYDYDIVKVCECPLTVSWNAETNPFTEVSVTTTSLTAPQLQEAWCRDELQQGDITGMASYPAEEGGSSVTVEPLTNPALIQWGADGRWYGAVVVRPMASEDNDTLAYGYTTSTTDSQLQPIRR